jgi:molecular chaperone HscA
VHFAEDGRLLVGARARELAATAPASTFTSIKRLMGRHANDREVLRPNGWQRVEPRTENEARSARFQVGHRIVTPVEISAEILRELAAMARRELTALGPAVITVPAYFDDAQRQATRESARLAGLTVARLLNEPTAALIAYGLQQQKNGLYAVYDLGGGTFDVTLLRLEDGVFQVKSTGGDSLLGGDDFDRLLAEVLLSNMANAPDALSAMDRARLLHAARSLKHQLSDEPKAAVRVELSFGQFELAMERDELERLTRPLLERTGRVVKRALRDAAIASDALDGIVLVGGMTRMPSVRSYVAELFERQPLTGIDPDRIVAEGAALRAEALLGSHSDGAASEIGGTGDDRLLLLDVLPLSLGIETMGGTVEKLLARNTTVPASARTVFTTHSDEQTGFELHVVQGERELAKDCRSLARFYLKGLPAMPAGQARLEMCFQVDESGLLTVTAREQTTGVTQVVEVSPSVGLSTAEIDAMLVQALESKASDLEAAKLAELRVHGQTVVRATEQALQTDGDLVNPDERREIEASLERLRHGLGTAERSLLLELLVEELHALTEGFSERRLHRSIAEAVTGKALR